MYNKCMHVKKANYTRYRHQAMSDYLQGSSKVDTTHTDTTIISQTSTQLVMGTIKKIVTHRDNEREKEREKRERERDRIFFGGGGGGDWGRTHGAGTMSNVRDHTFFNSL